MELILIACSQTKVKGGSADYTPPRLKEYLSEETWNKLNHYRMELAKLIDEPAGPDIGYQSSPEKLPFLPAYSRYAGKVYQRSNFTELFPSAKDKIVLIVSAFYGILEAGNSIRYYDLKMTEPLPSGKRLSTWWNQKNLSLILEECILSIQPEVVHDLLPGDYRKALEKWPTVIFEKFGFSYKSYDYPRQGMGSQWHRGDDLRRLLEIT